MIFWWGARSERATVGSAGLLHCNVCDKDSVFSRVVTYRVRHAYWVFRWATNRQLHLVCGNCGAPAIDDGDVRAPEVVKAIPAFDRRGWLIGAGILASLIVVIAVAGASMNAANRDYAAQPQAGDVYETNIARIVDRPEAPEMFGAIRVVAVKGDAVELELPEASYNKRRGVDRDIRSGALARPGYFRPEHMTVPRAELARMYADGITWNIER